MIYLGIILTIIFISLLVSYLNKISNKRLTANDNGVITLKMHFVTRVVGIILTVASIGLLILAIFTVKTTEDLLSAACLIILFLLLGVFLILVGTNYRFEVDEEGIKGYSILNKSDKILWKEIDDVRVNKAGSFILFYSGDKMLKLFIRLFGFVSFAEIASVKLDERMYINGFGRLHKYGINVLNKEKESTEDKIRNEIMVSRRVKSGANWFYWIAGLSIINTVISLSDGNLNFVIGLGITQIIDGIADGFSASFGTIAIVGGIIINLFIAGVFILFGVNANKAKKWSFVIGMVLYGIDGLIFVFIRDYFSIGFHLLALYSMFMGYKAIGKSEALAA
ncbi:MAG: hypothetical protein Q8936_12395 [Bacillota bacterium]|nr:hypothetical protein [Bacillota bacterium]